MTPRPIAVAVVLDDSGDRVLVGRRDAAESELGGCAEFPGGKQKRGENPIDAALRECREETGLAVQPVRVLQTVRHRYDFGELELTFVLCRQEGPATPRPPFTWQHRTQLDPEAFPPANRRILQWLRCTRPHAETDPCFPPEVFPSAE